MEIVPIGCPKGSGIWRSSLKSANATLLCQAVADLRGGGGGGGAGRPTNWPASFLICLKRHAQILDKPVNLVMDGDGLDACSNTVRPHKESSLSEAHYVRQV